MQTGWRGEFGISSSSLFPICSLNRCCRCRGIDLLFIFYVATMNENTYLRIPTCFRCYSASTTLNGMKYLPHAYILLFVVYNFLTSFYRDRQKILEQDVHLHYAPMLEIFSKRFRLCQSVLLKSSITRSDLRENYCYSSTGGKDSFAE